jgi:hypothetical protein
LKEGIGSTIQILEKRSDEWNDCIVANFFPRNGLNSIRLFSDVLRNRAFHAQIGSTTAKQDIYRSYQAFHHVFFTMHHHKSSMVSQLNTITT